MQTAHVLRSPDPQSKEVSGPFRSDINPAEASATLPGAPTVIATRKIAEDFKTSGGRFLFAQFPNPEDLRALELALKSPNASLSVAFVYTPPPASNSTNAALPEIMRYEEKGRLTFSSDTADSNEVTRLVRAVCRQMASIVALIAPNQEISVQIDTAHYKSEEEIAPWHRHSRHAAYLTLVLEAEGKGNPGTLFAPESTYTGKNHPASIPHPQIANIVQSELHQLGIFSGDVLHASPIFDGRRTLARACTM